MPPKSSAITPRQRVEKFLQQFSAERPAFFTEVNRSAETHERLFYQLAEPMLEWAELTLGPTYVDTLVNGYCVFVTDVNRSQICYEQTGSYVAKSYDDVYEATYDSAAFMSLYHWGVYTTTFGWGHHLRLFDFFQSEFLVRLREHDTPGKLVDLGCGSGIWHLLALRELPQWQVVAVDVSQTSIKLAKGMCRAIAAGHEVTHIVDDALTFQPGPPADAGLSCFLLEHLEQPLELLKNLARCLDERSYAFVTCALTAAEVDHIYEFRHESEVVRMVEDAGFRVTAMLSAAPTRVPVSSRFLPRSMALVVQKRKNEIW